jgi:uncharacterized LabA/DUF88 family protein
MSILFEGQRVAILVDTANMYHSAKSRFQSRVDYKRLIDLIVRERRLVRAIAFIERNEDVEITPFVDALRGVGFETRVKTIRRHADFRPRGGDWDIGIALQATQLIPKVDCIALVSGDGAFVDLIEFINLHGVRTEVYAFEGCVSSDLTYHADCWCPIDEQWLMQPDRS